MKHWLKHCRHSAHTMLTYCQFYSRPSSPPAVWLLLCPLVNDLGCARKAGGALGSPSNGRSSQPLPALLIILKGRAPGEDGHCAPIVHHCSVQVPKLRLACYRQQKQQLKPTVAKAEAAAAYSRSRRSLSTTCRCGAHSTSWSSTCTGILGTSKASRRRRDKRERISSTSPTVSTKRVLFVNHSLDRLVAAASAGGSL